LEIFVQLGVRHFISVELKMLL